MNKKNFENENTARRYIRFGIGLFFFISGLDKILHPHSFIEAVLSYQILHEIIAPFFAVIVMTVETVSGLAVMCNWNPRTFYSLLMIFLSLFLIAIIKILVMGNNIDCGCFTGLYTETVSPWLLMRNALLIVVVFWLSRSNESEKSGYDITGRYPD